MTSQLNAPRMVRPLLCASNALHMIGKRTISDIRDCTVKDAEKIPWHMGWVTTAKDKWESDHIVTLFDRWPNIFVKMKINN